MNKTSRMAGWFIGFMAVCGTAALGLGFLGTHRIQGVQFFPLLLIGIVGSRLKVKLPGLDSNMSVNLPFILLATLQLSLFEALIVALSSIMAQCYPAKAGTSNGVKSLFNLSTTAVAVVVAAFAAHSPIGALDGNRSQMLRLIVAGATFVVLQTTPVATIISLTDGGPVFHTWRRIARLSFPYYVLSTGVAAIALTLGQIWDWQIPILAMLTMYGIYRSYWGYFGQMGAQLPVAAMAKAAGH